MKNEFWAQLQRITYLSGNSIEVSFTVRDHDLKFFPGQYIWLILPQLTVPDPKGERRAFSITSTAYETGSFSIITRLSDSGYKKSLISLPQGSQVIFAGPYGSSYVPTETQETIHMIAGGVGIAPFLSIIRSIGFYPNHTFTLYYNFSQQEDFLYKDELLTFTSHHSVPFYSQVGRFDIAAASLLPYMPEDTYYICGPPGFVDTVHAALLRKGVKREKMHFEQHYPPVPGMLTEEFFKSRSVEESILLQAIHDSRNHVIITDTNGIIIFANKAAEKTTGYTLDEMRGNTPRLWGATRDHEYYKDFWHKKIRVIGFDGEITNRKKNGDPYHVIAHISPIFDKNNIVIGFIGTEEDITERVQLEQDLQKRNNEIANDNANNEALLSNIGDGLIFIDCNATILRVNNAFEEMTGWTEAEVIGKNSTSIVPRIDEAGTPVPFTEQILKLITKGKKVVTSLTESKDEENTTDVRMPAFYYARKDGSRFMAASIITPIRVNETVIGAVEVFRDMTREQEIDKQKTEFVSIASHQLRTPLGITKMCIETIKGDDYIKNAPANIISYLEMMKESNERVLLLVKNLLSISRIDQGKVKDNPQNTNIEQLVNKLVEEMNVLAGKKNIKLTSRSIGQIPQLYIDPLRLHEVIMNLVANALQYTPSGGSISITLEILDGKMAIQVQDSGIGISEEDKKRLFIKFSRLKSGSQTNPDGTGLGLYLVKSYIEGWGGSISIESSEGKGSSFIVILPLDGNH